MIYKVDGISGDIVVPLPTMMVRIGILSYRIMRGKNEEPVSDYHDCSKTPTDHWRGYQKQELSKRIHPVKQNVIDKWDIKIQPEIYQDLIELCFDPIEETK